MGFRGEKRQFIGGVSINDISEWGLGKGAVHSAQVDRHRTAKNTGFFECSCPSFSFVVDCLMWKAWSFKYVDQLLLCGVWQRVTSRSPGHRYTAHKNCAGFTSPQLSPLNRDTAPWPQLTIVVVSPLRSAGTSRTAYSVCWPHKFLTHVVS